MDNFNYDKTNRLRELKGWSWAKLGVKAELGGSDTIYTVRDGNAKPVTMLAVADALGVPLDDLMHPLKDEVNETEEATW